MHLNDQPGNWFRSDTTGTPVSVIDPGDRIDFRINACCTNTRHTITLLVKPVGSAVNVDQPRAHRQTIPVVFDVPGVYVFVCKVHPYMTAVVAVRDANGNIPPVSAEALPFIGHLGQEELPAATVLSVMTTIAPDDAAKKAKWDILGPDDEVIPEVPGIGEIWVDAQFERVPGQTDSGGVEKPGTIVVIDAATFRVEREINGLNAGGFWNNPHNMWADFALDNIYNSNWFGRWINKIDRETGEIIASVEVGEAPTHIITIPTEGTDQLGVLTIPLSADNNLVKVRDLGDRLEVIDIDPTGAGNTHPHGHWLNCGEGDRAILPNVFKGFGVAGSISILDSASGAVLAEFDHDPNDDLRSALLMPIASSACHVDGVTTAYVANLFSGIVTVINVDTRSIVANIPVTLTPDGQTGFDLLNTLQGPIQTPVSPDEKWVVTAVFSLTTVPRERTGSADHVALIDTSTNEVVKFIPTPAGTHGVNWGAKLGGGYYAYVTNQHANVLTVIDPDPNGDGDGSDADAVGTILLANGSEGAGVTDGTGGQGVKPLPMVHDGWVQKAVALVGTPDLSEEVTGWIELLTDEQKDPDDGHHDAALTDFRMTWGVLLSGGVEELRESDDAVLETQSAFGFLLTEPNLMEFELGADAADQAAKALDLLIESSTDEPGITAIVRLRNWRTGDLEEVAVLPVSTTESVQVIRRIDATDHIREGDGRIELRIKHLVVAKFNIMGFSSAFDQIEVRLHSP